MDGGSWHCIGDRIKTIPKKKKCKKAKWLSEEALQISVRRREAKGKGEKERYTHLNSEFQRTARRDKKAVLSNQCKEIEENNRVGKTRVLFKKIRDTKGTFHAKMGSIKDRNGMDLTEAEECALLGGQNQWVFFSPSHPSSCDYSMSPCVTLWSFLGIGVLLLLCAACAPSLLWAVLQGGRGVQREKGLFAFYLPKSGRLSARQTWLLRFF